MQLAGRSWHFVMTNRMLLQCTRGIRLIVYHFDTRTLVRSVRFCDVREGLNDTAENLLSSIKRDESEISASTVFAVASILEGCCYINGSPQNTFVPGVLGLAQEHNVHIGKCRRRPSACRYMYTCTCISVSA